MSRGGWRYVVAVVGLALLAASPPEQTTATQDNQTRDYSPKARTPSPAIADKAIESPDLTEPCEPGEENRKSDLCAQWKAADAAADSAYWTWLGVGVGFATLVAAAAAALFAGLAARAAAGSNKLVFKSQVAEQRPWIGVQIIPINLIYDFAKINKSKIFRLRLKIKLHNYGRLPARVRAVRAASKPLKASKPDEFTKEDSEIFTNISVFPTQDMEIVFSTRFLIKKVANDVGNEINIRVDVLIDYDGGLSDDNFNTKAIFILHHKINERPIAIRLDEPEMEAEDFHVELKEIHAI